MGELTRTSGVEPTTGLGPDRRPPEREERGGSPAHEERRRLPRDIRDVAQMMGIPTTEMTPRVREALEIIVGEYDRVRSELERERERVAYYQGIADHHSLLPVLNRRTFLRELTRLINRAAQTQTVSSVVLLHVSNLDAVRIRRGRAAADAILGEVAQCLTGAVRASDVVASFGGSDFAVILTLTEAEAAATKTRGLAEAVRLIVEGRGEQGAPLGVAWGIHAFTAEDEADQVIERVDRDLLQRQANPD